MEAAIKPEINIGAIDAIDAINTVDAIGVGAATGKGGGPGSGTTPEARPAGWIPGNKGIWVGITCEFIEFALMFAVYFIARAHYPEAFANGSELLNKTAGTTITVLMVTSSFFLACSVAALRAGRPRRQAVFWLVAALVVALGYPVVKVVEITGNLAHGIDGSAGIFYTVYYYLTFNHLVHASWGILGMVWVLVRLLLGGYTREDHSGLESLASYWHATDIIWLILFPLFYVLA